MDSGFGATNMSPLTGLSVVAERQRILAGDNVPGSVPINLTRPGRDGGWRRISAVLSGRVFIWAAYPARCAGLISVAALRQSARGFSFVPVRRMTGRIMLTRPRVWRMDRLVVLLVLIGTLDLVVRRCPLILL